MPMTTMTDSDLALLRLERGKWVGAQQTVVLRGGMKRRRKGEWYGVEDTVLVSTNKGTVELSSFISSAGGGDTSLSVRIGPKDFPALLRAMSAVAGKAAHFAMCEELRYQLGKGLSAEQKNAPAIG